ncbi:hypothetical protein O181_014569 [Austropuccinia psidii MF-1]|uniref:Uncharacterized protein n=1 Tax=Austropuccinia psidii MF-1 TaxID=1389203 RepID=A0A9Q3BYC8_9BASI|nr:hypothetical protein [Austropuccinia psidii MF-1]
MPKKIKHDQTGSTKSMADNLMGVHQLENPNKKEVQRSSTLYGFLKHRFPKKRLCPESSKTSLVYFISQSNLPLSITESASFQALLEIFHPGILKILVWQNSLTAHLSNVFFFHQQHIHNILASNVNGISFTTDVWTSPHSIAFMGVTAHLLDNKFELISVLLRLSKIEGDWKKTPVFDPNQQAIGCMAHTIHLTAHDGLNALGSQPDSISEEPTEVAGPMSISNLVDPPDGLNLNYNSIVSRIAQLASYINQSPQ